jgi:hypothetical protein
VLLKRFVEFHVGGPTWFERRRGGGLEML